MNQNRPKFLIIGAQKAGTTSLARSLAKHPNVFFSEPKEPEYFSQSCQKGGNSSDLWARYLNLFRGSDKDMLCGEASTGTITFPECISEIQACLPDVRLIALLRCPEQRAFSGFSHSMKKGLISVAEENDLFEKEAQRYLANQKCEYDWFYRSEYGRQLKPFAEAFESRLKIIIFEEMVMDQKGVMSEILSFLDLKPVDLPLTRENQTRVPKGVWEEDLLALGRKVVSPIKRLSSEQGYRKFRELLMRHLGKRPAPCDLNLMRDLHNKFSDDIEIVEDILGRSIEVWNKI